jgi:hypothetical protein
MDCMQCAENLTAYQDAELSAAEADEVRRHLQVCKSCADELQSLRKASEYIESRIQELNPKPETWNLVRARIADTRIPDSPWRFFSLRRRLATAAMAVFLVAGAGYMQYRQFERRSLDQYISKYVQERSTRIRIKSVLSKFETGLIENPYADNPFIEFKATPVGNPFRLEDR